jgi:Suppressor of fused protein (SUFU)
MGQPGVVPNLKDRLVEYLAWLDARAGREPEFASYDQGPADVPVTVMTYRNLLAEGTTLAFTFGVSEPRPPGNDGMELLLRVDSLDSRWGHALGVLGETMQGSDPEVGATCEMGAPLSDDTTMSSFVLAPPAVSTDESIEIVHLSDGHLVLRQAVPIYSTEREYLLGATDRVEATRRLTMAIDDGSARPDRKPVALDDLAD